jgi:hypothetical protein
MLSAISNGATMVETARQPEVLIGGGFRIEIAGDELNVTADKSRTATQFGPYLVAAFALCAFVLKVTVSHDFFSVALVGTFFVVVFGMQYFLARDRNLRSTRDTLQVVEMQRGNVSKTTSYGRSDVGQITFGGVSYSKYGATCGLIFRSGGNRVKMLYGLKCVEAQKILGELDRLGYDVEHDVGMPMMVEIELERRKSRFGWWS